MPGAARISCRPLSSQRKGSAKRSRCSVTGCAAGGGGAGGSAGGRRGGGGGGGGLRGGGGGGRRAPLGAGGPVDRRPAPEPGWAVWPSCRQAVDGVAYGLA